MTAAQSTSSVDPPAARTSARRSASSSARATTSSVSSVPARSRRRRASAGLAPPVLTAIDSGPLRAIGREDERAVGRLVGGVDPQPGGRGVGGDVGVDLRSAGGGDDEADAVEIVGSYGRRRSSATASRSSSSDVVGRDDADQRARGGQPGDLAGGDRTGADDEHRHAGHVQGNRIVERRPRETSGTPTKLMN